MGDALDDDKVGFVSNALVPRDPIEDDSSYLTIKVDDVGGTESLSVPDGFAAFLFGPAPSVSSPGPTRHMLIITAEVSVWGSVAYSLYHTRNSQAQAQNAPTFNPKLWQFSPVVGDNVPVEVHTSRTADQSVVIKGTSWTMTPVQAVEALLVNNKIEKWLDDDAQDGQDWKGSGFRLQHCSERDPSGFDTYVDRRRQRSRVNDHRLARAVTPVQRYGDRSERDEWRPSGL